MVLRKSTIRNGTLTLVEVGEDIPAIETIEHATGWPFSQGAHSRLIFQSLAEMASADIQIQLYGGNFYETPVQDNGVTVLSSGPMKTAKSVLFDQTTQPGLWPPHTVFVHSSRPHSLYHMRNQGALLHLARIKGFTGASFNIRDAGCTRILALANLVMKSVCWPG